MPVRSKLLNRKMLAAPIVMTMAMTAGCADAPHVNPVPPTEPTATGEPVTSATATAPPTATVAGMPTSTPTATPTTTPSALPVAEPGANIMRKPDGTCLEIFPEPSMECPPHSHCNPGPPREPEPVQCPPTSPRGPIPKK